MLVTGPPYIRSRVAENDRVRLASSDCLEKPVEVIDHSLLLVIGSIQPRFEYIAVSGQNFAPLLLVDPVVLWSSIERMITVPRRDINSKLKPILAASRRHLFEDVALSIPPSRVFNRVGSGIRRPQAEAVVMLGCDDHAPHASVFDHPGPLAAIQRRGVEVIRADTAFTPFLLGECIHSKMNECVVFQLLPGQLSMCRHRQDRRGTGALQQ